ncbi:hypothetical protein B0J11DRAFT_237420 [Dendryphion nanum]|uniref:Uncharacterized protein n=1 Tax=Dendryphion nanum TaxID=256645 RepID=A0A9P9I676_9PLEO|nr:hypothetical protein B0J11DRAFT_237420 [Dendryphion nanum]
MQAVICTLGSESGLKRILQLVKEDLSMEGADDIFASAVLPFFKTVGHPRILGSGLLENAIGTIYNTVFGPGGRYALQIYEYIVTNAASYSPEDTLAMIVVFAKILDFNETINAMEDFKRIAENLEIVIGADKKDASCASAVKWLKRAKSRLGIGRHNQTTTDIKTTKQRALSQFAQDLPGFLSKKGPRYDNDSDDVRNVRILPTYHEILSDRPPYLPTLDPSELHLPGIEGLIDRHFRLYREDTVGPIRDALNRELFSLRNPQNRSQNAQNVRTNVYSNLALDRFHCDLWHGPVITISIGQPAQVCNMRPHARVDWWKS